MKIKQHIDLPARMLIRKQIIQVNLYIVGLLGLPYLTEVTTDPQDVLPHSFARKWIFRIRAALNVFTNDEATWFSRLNSRFNFRVALHMNREDEHEGHMQTQRSHSPDSSMSLDQTPHPTTILTGSPPTDVEISCSHL